MKIAIVVHGRFHAFDLVRALLKRGNDVTIFTNYPRWAVVRFGIPGDRVRSFPLHGVLARAMDKVQNWTGRSFEAWTQPMFSKWAVRQLRRGSWDIIHAWSGISEEIYKDSAFASVLKITMRGSAHILTQAAILAEEQKRVARPIDSPSHWMIDREQREYALTDQIIVLSKFAYDSFRSQGMASAKLLLLPLGTETIAFRPKPAIIQARRTRILSAAPLRVLYVGGVCWRKGLAEIAQIIEAARMCFEFRIVGPVWGEASGTVKKLRDRAEFVAKKPHNELPAEYAWGDVFIFPTIEDGFAVVLAQASAAALPILTTTNCSGPDLVHEGRTGWVLPIRNAGAFLERLKWCDTHRPELAEMVTAAYTEFRTRDWSDVAADFQALCETALAAQTVQS